MGAGQFIDPLLEWSMAGMPRLGVDSFIWQTVNSCYSSTTFVKHGPSQAGSIRDNPKVST